MKKVISLFICLLICLSCVLPAFAAEKQSVRMPVGNYEIDSFAAIEITDGNLPGFSCTLEFGGIKQDAFLWEIVARCSSLTVPDEIVSSIPGNIYFEITSEDHDKLYASTEFPVNSAELFRCAKVISYVTSSVFDSNLFYDIMDEGREYSLVLSLYSSETKQYTDLTKVNFKISGTIFDTLYDDYYISCQPLYSADRFAKTYIQIYGKNRDANSSEVNKYTIQTDAWGTEDTRESNVLPEYSNVRNLPTGLKTTAFYVFKDGKKTYFEPGDYAYNNVRYLIEVAIDTSDFLNIIPGFLNYILFKIFEPIYSGALTDF